MSTRQGTLPLAREPSPWDPLKNRLFRALWMATIASNMGTWMQEVASGWLMTSLDPKPLLVALVQAATTLPMFLLALPAGALADVIDKRVYLLATQTWMAVSALIMGVITLRGHMTPELLLAFTFLLGLGTAMNSPAWHSVTPEVVGREQLAAAVTLNGLAINVARAVGPALGGLVVVASGPGAAFVINAISFLGVVLTLYAWRRRSARNTAPAERFFSAMRVGVQHVRHSPLMRCVLVRAGTFVFGSSCLWALLPLLVKDYLHRGPRSYGVLIALFGAGAVLGATVVLPRLRRRLSLNPLVSLAWAVFGLVQVALVTSWFAVTCAAMLLGGMAWLCILANLHFSAQAVAPAWVRARAMSVYLLVFFGTATLGSVVWGLIADSIGIGPTMVGSGAMLLVGLLLTGWTFPLSAGEGVNLSPTRHWPEPHVVGDYRPEHGPVLVTVDYRIDPANAEAFRAAMDKLRVLRLQHGVLRWGLFVDLADPSRYQEVYLEESWGAHLRQHERVTAHEEALGREAYQYHLGPGDAPVKHFVYTESAFPDEG